MPIVSISLNDNILEEIDKLGKRGYSGRSEVIRAAIRDMISNEKDISQLKGDLDGVLIISNNEKHGEEISEIRHKYTNIIKTQIHNHLNSSDKCLQIFVVSGPAEKIKALVNEFKISRKTEYAKLFVS